MEHSSLENPWNLKLDNYFSDSKNANDLKKHDLIGDFLFKNKPQLFSKEDDLVFCNVCNILLSKNSCLKHAQLHNDQFKDINLVYTVSSDDLIKKEIYQNDLLNDSSQKSNTKPSRPQDKKRKVSEPIVLSVYPVIGTTKEDTTKRDDHQNFVPKSTLNAENPLRIKIQLQPKSENGLRNDNVFEYISTFCNDSKSQTKSYESVLKGPIEDSSHHSGITESNHVYQKKPVEIKCTSDLHRSCPATIVCGSLSLPQKSSIQNQRRVESPRLSQLPQIFQSFTNTADSREIYQRNGIKVQGLHKTLKPVSSTHSLDSSFGNTDHGQKSSRKVNGLFSQEDVQRCHKPKAVVENGHINKARIISSSPILLVPSESSTTRPQSARLFEQHSIRPFSQARPINTVMVQSEALVVPPTIRAHSSLYHSSRDLMAGDFFYDSTHRSNLSGQTNAPRSDADVHYLPSGSATIMSLPWEI